MGVHPLSPAINSFLSAHASRPEKCHKFPMGSVTLIGGYLSIDIPPPSRSLQIFKGGLFLILAMIGAVRVFTHSERPQGAIDGGAFRNRDRTPTATIDAMTAYSFDWVAF